MEKNKIKLALFDFCQTLVNFQTADPFIDFVREKNGNIYMRSLDIFHDLLRKTKITILFNKFFPRSGYEKKIKLLQLKGIDREKLNHFAELYYKEKIKPNLIQNVLSELEKYKKQNYETAIVSAGYSIYLKYFTKDFNIKHLIATEIAFDEKDKCLGKISGKDCSNSEKIICILHHFHAKNVNYKDSISYSDSMSDLPMLQFTGNGVVVSRSKSQSWSHQYNFKEIIWN